MGKLNDLAKEVILNSELIKPYRVSFKDIIFVKGLILIISAMRIIAVVILKG